MRPTWDDYFINIALAVADTSVALTIFRTQSGEAAAGNIGCSNLLCEM